MSEQEDYEHESMLSEHNRGEGIFKFSDNYIVVTNTALDPALNKYLEESGVTVEPMQPEFHNWLRSLANPYSLVSTMKGSYVTFSNMDDADTFRKDWQKHGTNQI